MRVDITSKDFAAAEKKALQVGAKKFFLEVSISSLVIVHRSVLILLSKGSQA
jgi:hypothetical protein